MSFYRVDELRDGERQELVRVSDDVTIAGLSMDCPEDNNFHRDVSPVIDELERLAARVAELEAGA